ncbi:MAG: pilus assembly protein [Luteococcus sp.]|uniref:TadE/TadG family type IV pilus assembly protein n=1 Tax=Luteococcus sp. TaxID=1969402 RepID=UPI002647A390|nr:TadE family protein [Luteococcus sp.]MDN5562567.1 pilus assembly protein [Luteococcus sp.]
MIRCAALVTASSGVTRRLRDDRGAAGPVTAAIVVPSLLFVIVAAVQIGLWYIARSAAMTAAEEGARVMAGQHATQSDGCSAARDFATRAGHNLFSVSDIGCTRGAQSTVTVTGRGISMVPGIPITVSQSATLPVERVS